MRVSWISSLTRNLFSGGSATARSPMTSTIVPPAPKVITGPNTGSLVTPIISSRPFGLTIIGSIEMPSIFALGRLWCTLSIMCW